MLSGSTVLVEGKRDLEALKPYCKEVFAVSGRSYGYLLTLAERSERLVLLFDMDKAGDNLTKRLLDFFRPYSKVDVELRSELAYVLDLVYFENFKKKYLSTVNELEVI